MKLSNEYHIYRPSYGKRANGSFIDTIQKLSRHVRLEPYKDAEIVTIICQRYPNFAANKIADKLLEIYKSLDYTEPRLVSDEALSGISFTNFRASFAKEGRFLSLRDLLKLCNRLVGTKLPTGANYQRHLVLALLSDLYECFLCFLSNTTVRDELAESIGTKLNINKEEVCTFVC